jgi:hypothetical protein
MKWKSLNFNALPKYNQSFDIMLLLLHILGFRVLHLRAQSSASSHSEFCISESRVLHLRTLIRAIKNAGTGKLLLKTTQTYAPGRLTNFEKPCISRYRRYNKQTKK